MKPFILALLLAAAVTAGDRAAAQAMAQDPPPPHGPFPAVTVQGTGEVRVAPDEATIRLGVLGQAATARAVMEKVNPVANAVLSAVRAL
ncbi:MAG TPA: SIMPL domain-containing protein, partial [Thermoanaerobaculia bacterium]|nr:SIMPL domain-containing protein [Thermoanaerobaculia bacterium]